MLTIPVRATKGEGAYYLVTTENAVARYQEVNSIFLGKAVDVAVSEDSGKEAEGIALKKKAVIEGKEVYLVTEDEFRKMPLPVLARNCLENGISKNLWYEEVVPHKSVFAFPVVAADSDKSLLEYFISKVNGQIIQFGGNASIGYGLCKVTVLEG